MILSVTLKARGNSNFYEILKVNLAYDCLDVIILLEVDVFAEKKSPPALTWKNRNK